MPTPLATILAVAAYGAVHSLLASLWAKRASDRLFGRASARLYRLVYNVLSVLTLLPVLAIPALDPGAVLYAVPWPWSGVLLAGQLVAVLLLVIGLLQTGVWHFIGFRQLIHPQAEEPPQLVISGLYRWVRHPLYSAGLAFLWLTPLMTTSVLALNVGLSLYIWIGSIFEERRLLTEIGAPYAEYQKRVPRLLPRLLPARRPPTTDRV